jgi:hypothetical protein
VLGDLQQRCQRAQAAGMGEGLIQQPAHRPLGDRASMVALDLRAHPLDQTVVANPGGARRDARHAAQTAIEVGDEFRGELGTLLQTLGDEHDPPAG